MGHRPECFDPALSCRLAASAGYSALAESLRTKEVHDPIFQNRIPEVIDLFEDALIVSQNLGRAPDDALDPEGLLAAHRVLQFAMVRRYPKITDPEKRVEKIKAFVALLKWMSAEHKLPESDDRALLIELVLLLGYIDKTPTSSIPSPSNYHIH